MRGLFARGRIGRGARHLQRRPDYLQARPNDAEELLTRADALMYEAKLAGGDRVRHARVGARETTTIDGRILPFTRRPGA